MEAFALSADAPRVPLPQRLLSDERLLRLVAAGNPQAFGAVYARYHAPLYAYCRSIVRDPDDARDALQNTMLKALAALGRGEERQLTLKPWLFRIAHNESITLLRKRRPSEPLTDAVSPPTGDTHGEVEARERLTQLVEDLQALPERQRGALIMREVNGLSYEDIAAALAISPGAARQTVFEARSALVEYGEGREVACENIRRSISDGDGRALRARRVRAHLRACNECRDFQSTLQVRRRDLALLAPGLSGGGAVALLQGVLGAGVAGSAGGGATAGGAGLLGGSASALMGSGAAKTVVAIVAASAAGAGAVKLETDAHRHARKHFDALTASAAAQARTASPTATAASAGTRAAVAPSGASVAPATATVPNVLGRPDAALGVLPGRGHHKGAGQHGNGASDHPDHGRGAGVNRPGEGQGQGHHRGAGYNGWADDGSGDAFDDFSGDDPAAADDGGYDDSAPVADDTPTDRPQRPTHHRGSRPAPPPADDTAAYDDAGGYGSSADDPAADDTADTGSSEPTGSGGAYRPHRGGGGSDPTGSGGGGYHHHYTPPPGPASDPLPDPGTDPVVEDDPAAGADDSADIPADPGYADATADQAG
jgi:RNA polymerase sigma factor (sigma-70 family)